MKSRTNQAFKSQNFRKTNKTFHLLEGSFSVFKSWIIHQIYGDMTLENYRSIWQSNNCLPIASFNLFYENDVKKSFNCTNLRPMYSSCKPPKKRIFRRIKNIYNHIDEIERIESADLTDYKLLNNKGFSFIFIIIDDFSKKY